MKRKNIPKTTKKQNMPLKNHKKWKKNSSKSFEHYVSTRIKIQKKKKY